MWNPPVLLGNGRSCTNSLHWVLDTKFWEFNPLAEFGKEDLKLADD